MQINQNRFPPNNNITPGYVAVQGRLQTFAPADARRIIESRPQTLPTPMPAVPKVFSLLPTFNTAYPTIAGLAASLGNNIDNIFNYVASTVEFLPNYGTLKGAYGTMVELKGNAFDQSALMVALLRAAGYTAHFMFGELLLTAAQAGAWLGTDPTNIWASSNYLANGGIPVSVVWDAPSGQNLLHVSHVWVKADVTGTGSWFYFDPSQKSYTTVAAIDLSAATGLNLTNFQNACLSGATVTADYVQNVNAANLTTQMNALYTNLNTWLAANKPTATIDDLTGARKIVAITGQTRQATIPHQNTGVTPTEWTDIPQSYKTTYRFQYDTIDHTFKTEDLIGKRLTLFFNASLQAVLTFDGTVLGTSTAQLPGSWNSVLHTITHPYAGGWANQSFYQTVWAGNSYIVAHSWGNSSRAMAAIHQKILNDNRNAGGLDTDEQVLGEYLSVLWHTVDFQGAYQADIAGKLNSCRTVMHHQVGMVGHGDSPTTDIGGVVWSTSAMDNNYTRTPITDKVISQRGIAFESNSIAQIPGVGGVSSNTVMTNANAAGQKIYSATSANWATNVKPNLVNYDPQMLTNIENWYINAGWTVMIHQDGNTSQNQYRGYGFYAISPYGGCVGIINGYLKGGGGEALLGKPAANANAAVNYTAPDNLDRVELGEKFHYDVDNVNDAYTGKPTYRHTDCSVGPMAYPHGLPFIRFYTGKNVTKVSNMGRGWRHNYMIELRESNNGGMVWAGGTAATGIPNVVQTYLATLLLTPGYGGVNFALSMLSSTEVSKQMTTNITIVSLGDREYTFTKLWDGSFVAPKGVDLAIAKAGSTYTMQSFDGTVYVFNDAFKVSTITFQNGVVLTFTYSAPPSDLHLVSVSNNLGRTLQFNYTSYGQGSAVLYFLTSIASTNCAYTIDPATGNLSAFNDQNMNGWTYTYDSKFRMTDYFQPTVGQFHTTYDDLDRATSMQNPVYTTTFSYATDGSRVISVSPVETVSTSFNTDGQPTLIQRGTEATAYLYDGAGRVLVKTLADGDSISYTYDIWNRVSTQTHAGAGISLSESFGYGANSWNKWTSHIDARGNTWSRGYDGGGNVNSQSDPLGNTKHWTYHLGLMDSYSDETGIGVVNSWTGDLLMSATTPAGTSSFTYDAVGNKVTETNPRGFGHSYTYDGNRRVLTASDPDGVVTTFTYDTRGNQVSATRAIGGSSQSTSKTYNTANRVTSSTDSLGNVTNFGYDSGARLTSIVDPELRSKTFAYDINNRLASVTDATGTVEDARTYTAGGHLASISDAKGFGSSFTYDSVMRLTKLTYPDSSYEQWTYDNNGNVTSFRRRSGNTIGQTFDTANRVSTRSPQGQAVVTNSYDAAGRLLTASTPVVSGNPSTGVYSRSYDTAGRLASETNPQSQVVGYQYDANSNLTHLVYPSGYFLDRVYDSMDRLTGIKLNGAGSNAVTYGFDALGRRTSKNFVNGVNSTFGFDLGNNRTSASIAFVGSNPTWSYTFNKVHQMLTQNPSDSAYIWRPVVGTTAYAAVNNVNEYATVGGLALTWDTSGRLATYNGWTYGYNTENMLTSAVHSGTNASFVYDPFLRQTQKTVGSVKTKYVYSGSHMLEEYNGTSGTLTTRYVYGGADEVVMQMTSAGVVTYLHDDHVGSIISQSGSTGAVGNKYAYGPFGEPGTLTGTTVGYTGQRYDSETGLWHYKARYYHPTLGRFLQPDPVGYKAGLNLYAYVNNDPLDHTDPNGLEDEPLKGGRLQRSAFTDVGNVLAEAAASWMLGMTQDELHDAQKFARQLDRVSSTHLGTVYPSIDDPNVPHTLMAEKASGIKREIVSLSGISNSQRYAVEGIQASLMQDVKNGNYKTQPAKAAEHLVNNYGGMQEHWQKFETSNIKVPGRSASMSIHGFVNSITGEMVNIKTIIDSSRIK